MTSPHVGQSSLFFNMFVLLHIGQKLHTQFLNFSPPPFFMALQVFTEKSRKINMITRKDDYTVKNPKNDSIKQMFTLQELYKSNLHQEIKSLLQ
jgi:hypothetical protein